MSRHSTIYREEVLLYKMHTLRVTKTKIYFFLFFLTFAFFITTLFLHAFSIFYMVHNNHLHP